MFIKIKYLGKWCIGYVQNTQVTIKYLFIRIYDLCYILIYSYNLEEQQYAESGCYGNVTAEHTHTHEKNDIFRRNCMVQIMEKENVGKVDLEEMVVLRKHFPVTTIE